jgi:DNA polymerase
MKHLHVDIETYSSINLKTSGVYKYADSIDFEILCIAWSYGGKVEVCDWDDAPAQLLADLRDPNVKKLAHNATFERVCFKAAGVDTGNKWQCTAVLAGYNGIQMSLKGASESLELGKQAKSSTGSALIRYFCVPCKPTKTNGGRLRNFPEDNLEKYAEFKLYCKQDVVAEVAIYERLKHNQLTDFEQRLYEVDQEINENGITVDLKFIREVLKINETNRGVLLDRAKEITGLGNPNSPAQLQVWIEDQTGKKLPNLTKGTLESLDFEDGRVMEAIGIRQKLGKTSIKKYSAMMNCVMDDNKIRGLFQYYGANRTGRWAGRLVQLQNLPRNYMKDLDSARNVVLSGDYELLRMLFSDVQDTLSQLIRTSFIPSSYSPHLTMSDYSAIEARVLAWLADEEWRITVFRSKEKRDIYVESACMMFNLDISEVDYSVRAKGKVSELALGYQGAVGALKQMGAEGMGLTENDMADLVRTWRKANPAIVKFWYGIQDAALQSVKRKTKVVFGKFIFETDNLSMTIELPSGRKLSYWKAKIAVNQYGKDAIQYMGLDSLTRKWAWVDTYGGKLAENVTQAVARDFMAEAIVKAHDLGVEIAMHVHDEIVAEGGELAELERIMKDLPTWALDFPIEAVGEEVKYYQK